MGWVEGENARSRKVLEAVPAYGPIREGLLGILDSKERIPAIRKYGPYVYNFWQDDRNPRGVWRRTTMAEYRKESPAWEVVLDVDALAASEKENWVWHGEDVLEPEDKRCLIALSRGGGDAKVVREFDMEKKAFVRDGFVLPEAKSTVAWGDADTVYVGTDFGAGSLTTSGYPRVVKEWKRGMPLGAARVVYEGKVSDTSVEADSYYDHGVRYVMVNREVSFFSSEVRLKRGSEWVRVEKPDDAEMYTFDGRMMLRLRSAWEVGGKKYAAGTLVAADLEKYLKGSREMAVLFEPTATTALESVEMTKHYVILNTMENVASRVMLMQPDGAGWKRTELATPRLESVAVRGLDENETDEYLMESSGYLSPSTLSMGEAGKVGMEVLKRLPAMFDASGLEVQQFEAVSKDGTKVPYFQVSRKGMALDGNNPTLLYGYGGFQISLQPRYTPIVGKAWLERGGTYVVANIRGGGEFGPEWHNAARKEHRQRAYDDFIAVAESLETRKVTSPKRLGIRGESNGGLLMGVMITERPDLFGAVVCGSPLLDMRRYTKLPAGASWIDEYGDPEKPEEWEYIRKFSPYQNIKAGVTYPPILITTSTMDDRVHPGHARKMAMRLEEMGHEVLYYENTEGGHAAAANHEQRARIEALEYTFLWMQLTR